MAEFLFLFSYLGEGYIYQFQELFYKDRFVPYKYKPIKELPDNFLFEIFVYLFFLNFNNFERKTL